MKVGNKTGLCAYAFRAMALCGALLVTACGGGSSGGGGGGGGASTVALSLFAGNSSSADGFSLLNGVALDAAGNVYVADTNNQRIRKVTAAGVVTTLAGSGTTGSADGIGTAASFNQPRGVAVDSAGNVYVAEGGNHLIRKISAAGVVSTLAGSGTTGSADGIGTAASFNNPFAIAVDTSGDVYVADSGNHRIRKIDPAGVVTTLAGSTSGYADNTVGTSAQFNNPRGIAVDSSGNVYIGDTDNHRIRTITAAGAVSTLAGSGSTGYIDDTGTNANFNEPYGVAVDASGNVYVADANNSVIRKVTSAGVVTTVAGSTAGYADGNYTAAMFNYTVGVALDTAGNVYVGDTGNNFVRKIDSSANVTTFAGEVNGTTNGQGSAVRFSTQGNNIGAITSDAAGNIYVADTSNNLIRKITAAGVVSTLAGSGTAGFADGTGTAASFSSPRGIAVDTSGVVYVADSGNNRIRQISTAGVVSTLAGSGTAGSTNATGTAASFDNPYGIAVDASGNVYVGDANNGTIRQITAGGVVSTLAGTAGSGLTPFSLSSGLAVDSTGNVFVSDNGNNTIHKVTPLGVVTTLAGSGTSGSADGTGTAASFNNLKGIAIDSAGNLYVTESGPHLIRKITPAGVVTTLVGQANQGGFTAGALPGLIYNPEGVTVSGNDLYFTIGSTGIAKVSNVAKP